MWCCDSSDSETFHATEPGPAANDSSKPEIESLLSHNSMEETSIARMPVPNPVVIGLLVDREQSNKLKRCFQMTMMTTKSLKPILPDRDPLAMTIRR